MVTSQVGSPASRLAAGDLSGGQLLRAGPEGIADPVERVVFAAAVIELFLLDSAGGLLHRLEPEPYYVEGVEHRGRVVELVMDGVVVAAERVQGGDLYPGGECLAALLSQAAYALPEGHLLDQAGRGVVLELLLARLLAREEGRPRTVFVSAIVPNIEEINAWLGGSAQSVVRSDFWPAEAEYAVLRPSGTGRATRVGLQMQAVESNLQAHTLPDFLQDSGLPVHQHADRTSKHLRLLIGQDASNRRHRVRGRPLYEPVLGSEHFLRLTLDDSPVTVRLLVSS
jgi:hypothetical protein